MNIYFIGILSVFIIVFYKENESTILIHEIFNNLITTRNIHIKEIYAIRNEIKIIQNIIYETNYIQKAINTEYITSNIKNHKNIIYAIITTVTAVGILQILLKIQNIFLYKHEIEKIKKYIYYSIGVTSISVITITEIITGTMIKKNINTTEILHIYNLEIKIIDIIVSIVTILIYAWYTQRIYERKKEPTNKNKTKIACILLYSMIINLIAQYAVYESIILLLGVELIIQCLNMKNKLWLK